MKKEFIVERGGQTFVLYKGLLDLCHQQGLKSIRTELIQIPSETNRGVAICTATVTIEKDGQERVFTGIGDAAVNNVAPVMATCLIRMAETRAKARALRDAVNVGVAAFEELGEDDAHDGAPERGYAIGTTRTARMERPTSRTVTRNTADAARPTRARSTEPTPIPAEMQNPAANPITDAQTEAIRSLCRRSGLEVDTVAREKFSVENLAALNQAQAGELIRALGTNGRAPARA